METEILYRRPGMRVVEDRVHACQARLGEEDHSSCLAADHGVLVRGHLVAGGA